MDVLIEFVLEFLLQGLFELITRGSADKMADWFSARRPWLKALGHIAMGLISGVASLLIFPNGFIQNGGLRVVNLFATPVALGLAMMALALYRDREEDDAPLDQAGYAFLFAIAMAMVRFVGTR